MKLIVSKSSLNGTVAIPASKSHTIRAVAIASLAGGHSVIGNPLASSDTTSAVDCYRALGARIECHHPSEWTVDGTAGEITVPKTPINVGNSGTTLRLAMSSAALSSSDSPITITGDDQIQARPVGPLLKALADLGAKTRSINANGKPPVTISGTFAGGKTSLKCITSQYLSSLLLAAPLEKNDTEINVTLLNEPDYVQMTLDWLDKQDIIYENQRMQKFTIPGKQKYKPFELPIPADFSSATFFLCAAAILQADITLTGLDFDDSQPDKTVAEYLKSMGALITIDAASVRIKGSQLTGAEIDMNRTPDALPAMAVAAAFAQGETRLVNVPQARNKETDRITCMTQELKKMGANIEELPEGLIIRQSKLKSATLDGRGDHRIVMALSLAAMATEGRTTIDTAEAINVTFPDYVKLMTDIGANMKIEN
jgi:3-phosphoshikimate 1-carboxyvinyltransferase